MKFKVSNLEFKVKYKKLEALIWGRNLKSEVIKSKIRKRLESKI